MLSASGARIQTEIEYMEWVTEKQKTSEREKVWQFIPAPQTQRSAKISQHQFFIHANLHTFPLFLNNNNNTKELLF